MSTRPTARSSPRPRRRADDRRRGAAARGARRDRRHRGAARLAPPWPPRPPRTVNADDVGRARAGDRRGSQAHAGAAVAHAQRTHGRRGLAEGREPAAHGLVQDPRRAEPARGARGRVRAAGSPRAARATTRGRSRRRRARAASRARSSCRPRRRSPRPRAARRSAPSCASAAPRSRTAWRPPRRGPRGGHGLRAPLRRPRRRGGPGHARPRAARATSPTWRGSWCRSAGAGWPSGVAIAVKSARPEVEVVGVQVDTVAAFPARSPRRAGRGRPAR